MILMIDVTNECTARWTNCIRAWHKQEAPTQLTKFKKIMVSIYILGLCFHSEVFYLSYTSNVCDFKDYSWITECKHRSSCRFFLHFFFYPIAMNKWKIGYKSQYWKIYTIKTYYILFPVNPSNEQLKSCLSEANK